MVGVGVGVAHGRGTQLHDALVRAPTLPRGTLTLTLTLTVILTVTRGTELDDALVRGVAGEVMPRAHAHACLGVGLGLGLGC